MANIKLYEVKYKIANVRNEMVKIVPATSPSTAKATVCGEVGNVGKISFISTREIK